MGWYVLNHRAFKQCLNVFFVYSIRLLIMVLHVESMFTRKSLPKPYQNWPFWKLNQTIPAITVAHHRTQMQHILPCIFITMLILRHPYNMANVVPGQFYNFIYFMFYFNLIFFYYREFNNSSTWSVHSAAPNLAVICLVILNAIITEHFKTMILFVNLMLST